MKEQQIINAYEIAKERYIISKHLNTSYVDLGKITPVERKYLLEFLMQDAEEENKLRNDAINKAKQQYNN